MSNFELIYLNPDYILNVGLNMNKFQTLIIYSYLQFTYVLINTYSMFN